MFISLAALGLLVDTAVSVLFLLLVIPALSLTHLYGSRLRWLCFLPVCRSLTHAHR